MSSRQYVLFKTTAPESHAVPGVGAEVKPQRLRDEIGNVQVTIVGGPAKIEIQGRIFDYMPWSVLATVDETDMDATNTAIVRVPIFRAMRAEVTSGTATEVIAVLQE